MINRLPNGYVISSEPATQPEGQPLGRPPEAGGLSSRLLNKAAASVGTHPVASLGLAFATGLLLGKLVKR